MCGPIQSRVKEKRLPYWSDTSPTGEETMKQRLSGIHGWVFCMIVCVNYMYVGFGNDNYSLAATLCNPNQAQLESLVRFHLMADEFLSDNRSVIPD